MESEPGDADLVSRVRNGDPEAWRVLMRRHAGAVAAAVVGRGAGADRHELVHDAFSRAWERLDQLRDPSRFRPWVLAIARNLVVARARTNRVEPVDGDALDTGSKDPSPDELAQLASLLTAVRDVVVLLPRRDAVALTLAVDLGFGPSELAGALGVSEGNAKVILHRARRRLRAALLEAELL